MSDEHRYRYVSGERRPVEVLRFRVDPSDVDEFVRVDHEVWTLGEAATPGIDGVPFLSKEVWLDDSSPGDITIVIEWPSQAAWDAVDDPEFQRRLADDFDERFRRPYEVVVGAAEAKRRGLHRRSRFAPEPPAYGWYPTPSVHDPWSQAAAQATAASSSAK